MESSLLPESNPDLVSVLSKQIMSGWILHLLKARKAQQRTCSTINPDTACVFCLCKLYCNKVAAKILFAVEAGGQLNWNSDGFIVFQLNAGRAIKCVRNQFRNY